MCHMAAFLLDIQYIGEVIGCFCKLYFTNNRWLMEYVEVDFDK